MRVHTNGISDRQVTEIFDGESTTITHGDVHVYAGGVAYLKSNHGNNNVVGFAHDGGVIHVISAGDIGYALEGGVVIADGFEGAIAVALPGGIAVSCDSTNSVALDGGIAYAIEGGMAQAYLGGIICVDETGVALTPNATVFHI